MRENQVIRNRTALSRREQALQTQVMKTKTSTGDLL